MRHELKATPDTVHWGYFDHELTPVLHVRSGDTVEVETITHHAGDAPDLMMDGHIRELFAGVPREYRGPGKHLMTGPIFVEGAQAGDMLEVEYACMSLRHPYGSNVAAGWGYLHVSHMREERVTVYELDEMRKAAWPSFSYAYPGAYTEPGRVVRSGEAARDPAQSTFRVPLRPHVGCAGVAPLQAGRISSVPPGDHGGNVDNWRMGAGSRMYYPVFHPGALFSLGDPHAAQGDGELSGTAVEASLDVTIRLTVRRDEYFPFPVLETDEEWMVHGFGDTLDAAMRSAAGRVLRFLAGRLSLPEREAYSLISAAVDFSVTQVVDGTLGVHARVPKSLFGEQGGPE